MEELLFKTENLSYQDLIRYHDLNIKRGKVTFISGESGTGKSTLLRLFNGILSPKTGRILYKGKDISEIDTIQLRKSVSLVNQDVFLFDESIKQNFIRFYEYREQTAPTDNEMATFLELCCVPFPLDKDCATMSGGERQRVYMAIFLSFLPEVLMLDEPTSALDQKNSRLVMDHLISFCKNKHMDLIVVSHDQAVTEQFAEENIVIERWMD